MKNKKYVKINYLVLHTDLNRKERRAQYVKKLKEWETERNKIVDGDGIMKDVKPTMAKGKNKPFIKDKGSDIVGKPNTISKNRGDATAGA